MRHKTSKSGTKAVLPLAFVVSMIAITGAAPSSAGQPAEVSESLHWAAYAVAATQWIPNPDNNPSWDPVFGPWSAKQATGAPDTYPRCADVATAWAPATPLDTPETLALAYDPPVESPTRIEIYETYSFWGTTGFVRQVELVTTTGIKTVFDGEDTTACPGILEIPLTDAGTVVGVVIHTQTLGYEEIDAVGLATSGTA